MGGVIKVNKALAVLMALLSGRYCLYKVFVISHPQDCKPVLHSLALMTPKTVRFSNASPQKLGMFYNIMKLLNEQLYSDTPTSGLIST